MKIHPDKFFMLEYPDKLCLDNLMLKFNQGGTNIHYQNPDQLVQIAKEALTEFRVNIEGVKNQFRGSVVSIDGTNCQKKKIVEEMARHLMLKDSTAPRKPPRIILMGPPGVEVQ